MAQTTDEKALRRLIRRSTSRRDWPMVTLLFNELGELYEEQEGPVTVDCPGEGCDFTATSSSRAKAKAVVHDHCVVQHYGGPPRILQPGQASDGNLAQELEEYVQRWKETHGPIWILPDESN